MFCNKVHNFVTGATLLLPPAVPPPARSGVATKHRRNFLRLDAEALSLIEQHKRMLLSIKPT